MTNRFRTLPLALSVALACGGGGPSAPSDRTPPAAPDRARVSASVPAAGASTVTGEVGAVEASATVLVANEASGGERTTAAGADGTFAVQIPAALGDPLSVRARDAAGNVGPALSMTAGPVLSSVRVSIDAGDGQVGVRGRPLVDPLVVRVTASGAPVAGLPVAFEIGSGEGTLGVEATTTDAAGRASTRLTLGGAEAAVAVRAIVADGGDGLTAGFEAEAVGTPVVERVTPEEAVPGERITIEGRNFSPVAGHDVVRVGGEPATVLSATRTAIEARVPEALTDDSARVEVSLTGVTSAPFTIALLSLPVPLPPVGAVELVEAPAGTGSVSLPFSTGNEAYLVAIESTSDIPAVYELSIAGSIPIALSGTARAGASSRMTRARGSTATGLPAGSAAAAGGTGLFAAGSGPDDPEHDLLRRGREILERRGPAPAAPRRALRPAADRTFHVADHVEGGWEERPARLAYEGSSVLVYVDDAVPESDFPEEEARRLGQGYDSAVHDPVRAVFGETSDLDGNGRTILLLTPLVNRAADDTGRLLGFFMPADLTTHPRSNRGEVLYLVVPDPTGRWERPTPPAAEIRTTLRSIAAHELVHLIAANERYLERRLPGQFFWLEEGLAHYGQTVAGLPDLGHVAGYLRAGTPLVSLYGTANRTRGAALLFLTRVAERLGTDVIGRMVTGPGNGVTTVESAVGGSILPLFHDWVLAMYGSVYPVPGLAHGYESLDLRTIYEGRYGPVASTNALGTLRATVGSEAPAISLATIRGTVTYLVVDSDRRLVVADLEVSAIRQAGLRVSRVRIR